MHLWRAINRLNESHYIAIPIPLQSLHVSLNLTGCEQFGYNWKPCYKYQLVNLLTHTCSIISRHTTVIWITHTCNTAFKSQTCGVWVILSKTSPTQYDFFPSKVMVCTAICTFVFLSVFFFKCEMWFWLGFDLRVNVVKCPLSVPMWATSPICDIIRFARQNDNWLESGDERAVKWWPHHQLPFLWSSPNCREAQRHKAFISPLIHSILFQSSWYNLME